MYRGSLKVPGKYLLFSLMISISVNLSSGKQLTPQPSLSRIHRTNKWTFHRSVWKWWAVCWKRVPADISTISLLTLPQETQMLLSELLPLMIILSQPSLPSYPVTKKSKILYSIMTCMFVLTCQMIQTHFLIVTIVEWYCTDIVMRLDGLGFYL